MLESPQHEAVEGLLQGDGQCPLPTERWAVIAQGLQLSDRELQIIQGLFNGKHETVIGRELCISTHTVHAHLGRLYRKLQVHGLPGLLLRVFAEYVACEPGRPARPNAPLQEQKELRPAVQR